MIDKVELDSRVREAANGAELLSILLAKVQDVRIKKSNEQREMANKHYLKAIEDRRNHLVNGMIDELGKWLDLGFDKSEEIITSYNI